MKEKYDVVIIGAGPAGLAAAKCLAENNKEVIVLEKNKMVGNKVCGGGLTKKDFEVTTIPFHLIEREFKSIDLFVNKKLVKIEQEEPFVWTIKRRKLGEWQLQEAKKAGAEVLLNAKVDKIEKNFVAITGKKKIYYDYLIGADGSNSLVRKYLNLKSEKVGVAIEYYIPINEIKNKNLVIYNNLDFNYWYFWIFPQKEFALVGTGADPKKIKIEKLKKYLDFWCERMNIDTKKYELKAALLNYDYRGVKFKNIFLAGDAAGLISALTGEGIYPAIISGNEIARKIINPRHDMRELKKVLKRKRFEERMYFIYSFNKFFNKIFFGLVFLFFKNNKIKKKAVNFFASR